MRILAVEEKIENVLTEIIKSKKNITKEYDSTKPGEPPTHFTELIQSIIHAINIKSPGNAKESGIESICVLHVYVVRLKKSFPKKLTFDRSSMEMAIILAANI